MTKVSEQTLEDLTVPDLVNKSLTSYETSGAISCWQDPVTMSSSD
jgi:hypothetical protein